ncbi:hypothetical protein K458DRAFT_486199 [Lentithecium fluviatile CBS 122367]|uniref:Uncharacterized protein n=1 Tax=Lentithecium fluviatile CBS 122367 TaxID=1168545 RepID=A0A6G1J7F0_9PLEO|nr:hypothetical protein K458DRAFT_486199 [Lentithecium fluviatile CBS 122367]
MPRLQNDSGITGIVISRKATTTLARPTIPATNMSYERTTADIDGDFNTTTTGNYLNNATNSGNPFRYSVRYYFNQKTTGKKIALGLVGLLVVTGVSTGAGIGLFQLFNHSSNGSQTLTDASVPSLSSSSTAIPTDTTQRPPSPTTNSPPKSPSMPSVAESSPIIAPTSSSSATPAQTSATLAFAESPSSIKTPSVPSPTSSPAPTQRARLSPGDPCTKNSQCSTPNICYSDKGGPSSYCCGTDIEGCPGSPCSKNNCKDPYGCTMVSGDKGVCCGYPPFTALSC